MTTSVRDDMPELRMNLAERVRFDGDFYHATHYELSQTTTNFIGMYFKTPETDSIHLWIDFATLTGELYK